MENLMFKDMSKRYEEFVDTSTLEGRAVKNICFWVMSSMETFFWGVGRKSHFYADLYASSNNRILIIFHHPSGKNYEFEYLPTYAHDNIEISPLMEKVVTSLNNIPYPLTTEIPSPLLRVCYMSNCEQQGRYQGFEHLCIHVDMRPDADDDPANKGKH